MSAATSTPTPAPGATPRWGRGGAGLVPRIGDEFQCSAVQQGTVQASCCFRLPGGFDPRQIHPRLPPGPALARSAFGPDDLPLADRPGGPHPLAGALPRPPRQARPDLQTSAQADGPLPFGLRLRAIGPGKRPPDVCFRVLWQRQKSGTISASHGRRPLRLQALSPIRPDSKNAVCLPPCKTVSRFFLLDLARAKSSVAFPSGGRRVLARPARRGWIYRRQAPPGPRACARCVRAALTPLPCGLAPSGNRTLRPSTEGSRAGSSGSANR